MPIAKTEAFVLKTIKYGETSKIVTLFTKDFGKLNAIAKGARNYKSKLCGTLESMNYIRAVIYLKENRELQLISNAEYIKSFSNIQSDFEKLQASFKIIEILNRSVVNNDVNSDLFDILLSSISMLNNSEKNFEIFILNFQIELSKILGISPVFTDSKSNNETFFKNNEFYVNNSHISSLLAIEKCRIEEMRNLETDSEIISKLISTYERFLTMHTSGTHFYKTTKVFKELNYNSFSA
ncbi:MAG TPA: DNA repair protein RecO [Ignavibacteria bacterium]|nr:DNA repair protein RecO [Ignavibacteria bacterium]